MLSEITNMSSKPFAVLVLALAVIFIVFNRQAADFIRWLDKTIWNEERRRKFPGYGGNVDPKPWHMIVLGVSWIPVAIILWFIPNK
jgi:hypothetical protein